MSQQKVYKSCEQFVFSVYKTFENQPSKLQTFISLFQGNKRAGTKVLDSQRKLAELIKDCPELIEQLNKLLPDDFKVSMPDFPLSRGQDQEEEPVDLTKIFAELQARRPDKLQQIIELIQGIKNNKSRKNLEDLKERLAKILEDQSGLYNKLMRALRPYTEDSVLNGYPDVEASIEESASGEPAMEVEDMEESKGRNRIVRGASARGYPRRGAGKGRRGGANKRVEIDNGSPPTAPTISLPVTVRNELNLFENLRTSLNKANYHQLMKIIYLYTECVIGANEVSLMVKPLFKGNDNYGSLFQEVIFAREKTRRKNTTLFKPLTDIDFEQMGCTRNGSYSKLPEHFPHMRNPANPKNPMCDVALNKNWLSVPHGSEVNFQVTSKNTYEENLFKMEEERYEFDSSIYQYTIVINWLDKMDETESKDEINKIITKILKMKIVQKACGNNDETLEGFKKNPIKFAKRLSEKIQNKLHEIKETKVNQAKKKWHETSVENFHRGLDHRSFYFKQYEKKFTYHKNFISDALARHQDLNILGNMKNSRKYFNLLNTFEGISNGVVCLHPAISNYQPIEFDEGKGHFGRVLPIYNMVFPNKKINQEIYDMLNLKIQHFHANLTEKEKINRYLKVFLQEILCFAYEEGESYSLVFDEDKLLAIVARIQAKIFDKTFSFNTVKIEEAEKNNVEQTIHAAVQEGKKHMEIETTEDTEANLEKSAIKNGEPLNGTSQKPEEEASPKKRRKGEKREREVKQQQVDSEEPINVKEMEYSSQEARNIDMFEPIAKETEKVFYGTQHLYYLVRFYYTLYERFLKVYEISSEFELNPKSSLLSEEMKERLAKERYDTFKWVLAHLIRSNIENEKYEDLLRCVFGNKAYLMFYIDRIIHMFIITIQKLMNDDTSVKTLNFFTNTELPTKNAENIKNKPLIKQPKNWPEYVYLAQINQLTLENMGSLQATTFFRFVYDPQECIMKINIYDSSYRGWNEKVLDTVCEYSEWYRDAPLLGNCLNSSSNIVYLERNKEENKKRIEGDDFRILHSNKLEWKYLPNTTKLVTDSLNKEDVLLVLPKKKEKTNATRVIHDIKEKYKRLERFEAWHKKKLKNLGL